MLNIFSPLTLGHIRLPNRIVLAAAASGYAAPGGFADSALMAYYVARARGGVGMLVFEHCYALPPLDRAIPHLGLYGDAQISGLHHCFSAVHREGAAVLLMIDQPLPIDALSQAELIDVAEAFIMAAWRARAAGADGVMFSLADGGPFEHLVSPLQNQRSDRFGGNSTSRLRLLLDVLEGVQKWIGDRLLVGVRLNAEEFAPGGLTLQDARVIAKRLIGASVKLLEITTKSDADIPIAHFPGWQVPLAAGIRAVVDVPVLVGSLSDDLILANNSVADGSTDLVAMNEVLRVDPDWPRQMANSFFQSNASRPDDSRGRRL